MANEITVNFSITLSGGNYKWNYSLNEQFDQSATGFDTQVQSVGTSEEDITFTGISTEGWLFMRNLDGTNYVDWGAKDESMKTIGRLQPDEFCFIKMNAAATLRMQANTAACEVLIVLLEA